MALPSFTRRGFFSAVSGAALLPLASRAEASPGEPVQGETFAGLAQGSRFGRWEVAHVAPLDHGGRIVTAMPIGASSSQLDALFELEILAKDEPGAARPPAESARFAVFVRNSGDGDHRTIEDHGLAAMTLADHLRAVEASIDASGFMTHAARTDAFAADLRAGVRASRPRLLR